MYLIYLLYTQVNMKLFIYLIISFNFSREYYLNTAYSMFAEIGGMGSLLLGISFYHFIKFIEFGIDRRITRLSKGRIHSYWRSGDLQCSAPPLGKFDPPPCYMWPQKLKIWQPPLNTVEHRLNTLDFQKKFTHQSIVISYETMFSRI